MNTFFAAAASVLFSFNVWAGDVFHWQKNEVHLQYGTLDRPYTGGLDQETFITTFQHVDGWKYGNNFFFIDFIEGDDSGSDIYFEGLANFSLGKILDKEITYGPIKDVGVVAGLNWAKDAKVYKYIPGVRVSWDVPGFTFFNTDLAGYIDNSRGVAAGGTPSQDNSFIFDVSFAYPFELSEKHKFSVEGHVEYIGARDNEFGNEVKEHILAQPQFRYDIGHALFGKTDRVFAGIEYQYWMNKLGDDGTDESAIQALLVGRF